MSRALYFILVAVCALGAYSMKDRYGVKFDAEDKLMSERRVLSEFMNKTSALQSNVFATADTDGDGKISVHELLALGIPVDHAQTAVRIADMDLDGKISQFELFNAPKRPVPYLNFRASNSKGDVTFPPSCLLEQSQKKYWQWVKKNIEGMSTSEEEGQDPYKVVGAVVKERYKDSVRDLGYLKPYTPTTEICQQFLILAKLIELEKTQWFKWLLCENFDYYINLLKDPVGYLITSIPTSNADRARAAKRIEDYYIGSKHNCKPSEGL